MCVKRPPSYAHGLQPWSFVLKIVARYSWLIFCWPPFKLRRTRVHHLGVFLLMLPLLARCSRKSKGEEPPLFWRVANLKKDEPPSFAQKHFPKPWVSVFAPPGAESNADRARRQLRFRGVVCSEVLLALSETKPFGPPRFADPIGLVGSVPQ